MAEQHDALVSDLSRDHVARLSTGPDEGALKGVTVEQVAERIATPVAGLEKHDGEAPGEKRQAERPETCRPVPTCPGRRRSCIDHLSDGGPRPFDHPGPCELG